MQKKYIFFFSFFYYKIYFFFLSQLRKTFGKQSCAPRMHVKQKPCSTRFLKPSWSPEGWQSCAARMHGCASFVLRPKVVKQQQSWLKQLLRFVRSTIWIRKTTAILVKTIIARIFFCAILVLVSFFFSKLRPRKRYAFKILCILISFAC